LGHFIHALRWYGKYQILLDGVTGVLGLVPLYEGNNQTRNGNEEMKNSNQRHLIIYWQLLLF
jgi:hypothetical protein